MTSAWRVVSLRYGSMLSMKSSPVERPVEPVAVGRRQHRVARDGDHRPDLPVAGGVDLLGERGGGQFGQRPPGSRRPGCASGRCVKPRPGPGGRGRGCGGPSGNIAPPGRSRLPVRTLTTSTSQLPSVPNSTVDVPIRPYTAAVGAAASSRASVRMSSAGDAAVRGDGLRREVPWPGSRTCVDAGDVLGEPRSSVDKALFEQHVDDGEQQRGVGAGPRRDVAVGEFGGAGAGRVDDDEPAAARAQRRAACRGSRRRWPDCRWTPGDSRR